MHELRLLLLKHSTERLPGGQYQFRSAVEIDSLKNIKSNVSVFMKILDIRYNIRTWLFVGPQFEKH